VDLTGTGPLPWKTLEIFCRSMSTLLSSGVNVLKAFQVAGTKSLDPRLKRISREIVDDLRSGSQVADAMRQHGGAFPVLMIDLIDVAEQTGALPEVMAALASHYDNLVRLRRTFVSAITWPVFQLVLAILIIAGLILVLGMIAQNRNAEPVDVLGLGLVGVQGSILWLSLCAGSAFLMYAGYQILTRSLSGLAAVHSLLLRIPVLGPCLRAFAIARFSWAFALTQQAGMSIQPSLEASLKATANGAFIATIPQGVAMLTEGEELSTVLEVTGLYPLEYLELVRVGEATGTVPEALERISPQLEDEARRRLEALTAALAWLVWLCVAGLIAFIIIRVFLTMVINPLQRELGNV